MYFLPNAQNNAYNYLVEPNDSAIIASNGLTISTCANNFTGMRMNNEHLVIGASTSSSTLDNRIYFNTANKTITIDSPNWVACNQCIICPDYYISGTNESIVNIIGALRTADTTETTNRINGDNILAGQYTSAFNSISVHTDNIGALQTKTQKITCNGTETHFSSNVVVDNNASEWLSLVLEILQCYIMIPSHYMW
jgi:hypothetical protein